MMDGVWMWMQMYDAARPPTRDNLTLTLGMQLFMGRFKRCSDDDIEEAALCVTETTTELVTRAWDTAGAG